MSCGSSDRRVAVYSDEGTSPWCVECTCKTLARRSYTPVLLSAEDVISGTWTRSCVGIVFPGGRDTPYHEKLKGTGNTVIRQFVECAAGWYLGICAGGYYGSSRVEFCEGDETMEILADRELAFFPGTAAGPRYPGYSYQDNSGEHVVSLSKRSRDHLDNEKCGDVKVYFNGGCCFTSSSASEDNQCPVLWEYGKSGSTAPAVVGCCVGRGRAVLSGVHPEVGAEDVDNPEHSETVISEMKRHESDRETVLSDIFRFLEADYG